MCYTLKLGTRLGVILNHFALLRYYEMQRGLSLLGLKGNIVCKYFELLISSQYPRESCLKIWACGEPLWLSR
jgi:hypothetical protein